MRALCSLSHAKRNSAKIHYGGLTMSSILKLPIEDRIRLVEDIWDSIAADQLALDLTQAQKAELDKRLDAFEKDGDVGREVSEVISDIRSRL